MKNILFLIIFILLSMPSFSQKDEGFTIIGKTKDYKDSTILYIKKNVSGFIMDDVDSTYVINNAFIFKGKVSEPHEYFIHNGYTGWEADPPESFHAITFWVSNDTIYLNDEIGNLRYSTISGSQLQNDNNLFNTLRKPFVEKCDSLFKLKMDLSPSDSIQRMILQTDINDAFVDDELTIIDFIKSHSYSIISAYDLNIYKNRWGKKTTSELFSLLDTEMQNSSYGESIKLYLKKNSDVKIGNDFVDLELNSLEGIPIKLSSLKGKFILLEFWSSYCGPCRAEHPHLREVYNKYKEKGFEIYAVCLDDKKESWEQTVAHDKISWITVSDLKGAHNSEPALIYGVTAIPQNYLINREGKIIANNLRGDELTNKLKEIFKDL